MSLKILATGPLPNDHMGEHIPVGTIASLDSMLSELYANSGAGISSVSATLGTGPFNDLGAGTITGFVSGTTTRLMLTANSAGTTINSLDASGYADGQSVLITNEASAGALSFTNLGGGTASNQFQNVNAATVSIGPGGAARANRVGTKWRFA